MNLKPETTLFAALVGWMLSGSPVPMALTLALLLSALIAGGLLPHRRPTAFSLRRIAPPLLVGAAAGLQIQLFLDGRALAVRADLPLAYHLGLAALWWATLDSLLSTPRTGDRRHLVRSHAGLVGGLLVFGAAAAVELHGFAPWLVHSLAALPFVLCAARLLMPRQSFAKTAVSAVLPASLVLGGLVPACSSAVETLRPLLLSGETTAPDATAHRAPRENDGATTSGNSSRRIPREADVRFRHEVLVLLRPHSEALFRSWSQDTLYVRTSTLALFESDEVLSPIRSGRWLYDQDDGSDDRRIPLRRADPDESPDPAAWHTFYVDRRSAERLPLAVGSSAIFLASVYEFADDWYQLSPGEGAQGLRYTAAAPPGPPAEIRSADPLRPARGTAPGAYLQLPPSPLPSRIDLLCREIDADLLGGIRSLLEQRTRYSLQFQTPEGSSPLAEFLFGHGLGHCEHYAAATVLMLRCLGIPSRVAYGYAGGLVDADQGVFAFRDSDFHAWAEILTPTNEWRIFDTTPRVASAAPRPSIATSLPPLDDALYRDLSDFDLAALAAPVGFGAGLVGAIDFLSRHFILATAVGLALCGGLWWLLPGNRGEKTPCPRPDGRPGAGAPSPTPAFLRELEEGARALGLQRRPGHTWHELLARLAEQAAVPDAVHEAVAYHYRTAYAGKERDPAEEARFREALRAWRVARAP